MRTGSRPVSSERPVALALRALGLGDFVTGLPALRLLRQALPEHRLILAAPAVFQPLLPLGVPVDALLPTGELQPVGWTGQVEVAVDLHGNGPASRVLLQRLGPSRLIGFGHPAAGLAGPPWWPREHEITRWQRLIAESFGLPPALVTGEPARLAIPADAPVPSEPVPGEPVPSEPVPSEPMPSEPVPDEPMLGEPASDRVPGRLTVLHPGAAANARRWPVERFAAVARRLHQRGHRVAWTGSAAERPLVTELARATGGRALAGLDLRQLFAVVARARLVISGDTGVAHVASLYRTPSVVLFGPVAPSCWGPPASGPHRVLWHGDGTGDPHGDEPDPALLRITVAEVLTAVESLEHDGSRLTHTA
jgi:ADP-heptose:LPS heptosyltransferase